MPSKILEIPLIGPTNKQKHLDLNAQDTNNMYLEVEIVDYESTAKASLQSMPGTASMETLATSPVREILSSEDQTALYSVSGSTFYKGTVNTTAKTISSTSKGTLTTLSGDVSMVEGATRIAIVDGTAGYMYNPTADTFATITDVDFYDDSPIVKYLDGYFFFINAGTGQIQASELDDPSDIAALDFTTATGAADNNVTLEVFGRELWCLGQKTVEIYINTANASGFPFSRLEGAHINRGCGAARSTAVTEEHIIWLDDRGYVVVCDRVGYSPIIVSTSNISRQIQNFTTISDAKAFVFSRNGRKFYQITFPTEEKTFILDLTSPQNPLWYRRESVVADAGIGTDITRHIASSHAQFKHLDIVGAYNSGKLLHFSNDYFQDDGQRLERVRDSQTFQLKPYLVSINRLTLQCSTGIGTLNGTDSTNKPRLIMQYSNDGGRSWSQELWADFGGAVGEYVKFAEWWGLGAAYQWVFRFKYVDNTDFAIIGQGRAEIDLSM